MTRYHHRALALVLTTILVVAIAPPSSGAHAEAIVTLDSGPIRGVSVGGVTEYLGIPYAAPPIGALRWKGPLPPTPWTKVRDASAFADRCPQTAVVGEFSAPSVNEDCLALNVFVPTAPLPEGKRAVMVWIPGGGFFAGGANDYDATGLVETGNVIVVSLNYRIGALGFLTQPELDAAAPAIGNYGLLDQQFALRWIRKNIAAFGGDPDNVTLFGESAGAIAIYGHMASPDSAGLFHKAILESGFTDYPTAPLTNPRSVITSKRDADLLGQKFATAMGCVEDAPACLRRLPVEQIIAKQMPYVSGLIVGAPSVPSELSSMLRDGSFNRVPVLNGTNHDEWRWPIARTELRTKKPITGEQYSQELGNFFGDKGAKVAAEYQLRDFGSPSEALAAAETDSVFACGALRNDRWLAQYVPVYGYEFNDGDAPMYMPNASFPYGAAHTKELQFIFPLFHGGSGAQHPLTPKERDLSTTMIRYWTNFAKNGDPNGPGAAVWPKMTQNDAPIQSLTVPDAATFNAFADNHRCAFWSALQQQ